MTDQIHRIADKEPEFDPTGRCWLWDDQLHRWFSGSNCWDAPSCKVHGITHWSPDSLTAPEVRPDATQQEAGHARVMAACEEARQAVGKMPYGGPERQALYDSAMAKINASTPSPAAIAAAEAILDKMREDMKAGMDDKLPADQQQDYAPNTMAAIIDRHFNGQGEDSAHIWLVTGSCGEYSDFQQWNVAAFHTEAEAQKLADAAQLAAAKYPKDGTWKDRAEFKTSLDPQFKYDYTGTSYQVEMVELRRSAMSAQTQG